MSALGLLLSLFLQMPAMKTLAKGDVSNIDEARQVVVRSSEEWAKLWQMHSPDHERPAVDFARDMVVAVFLGSRPTAGYAVEIVGARETQGTLVVQYRIRAPGRDAITAQVLTAPYQLVLVPRHAGDVKFDKVP